MGNAVLDSYHIGLYYIGPYHIKPHHVRVGSLCRVGLLSSIAAIDTTP